MELTALQWSRHRCVNLCLGFFVQEEWKHAVSNRQEKKMPVQRTAGPARPSLVKKVVKQAPPAILQQKPKSSPPAKLPVSKGKVPEANPSKVAKTEPMAKAAEATPPEVAKAAPMAKAPEAPSLAPTHAKAPPPAEDQWTVRWVACLEQFLWATSPVTGQQKEICCE